MDYDETQESSDRMNLQTTQNIHRFAIYNLVVMGVSTHGGIFAFKRENLK